MYKYHQNGRYRLGPVAISSTVSEISNPVATFKIILSEYVKCIYITWRTCLIQMKSQTILLCMIRIKYYHLYILEVFFNLALLLTKRGFNMFWKMWLVLSLTNIFLVAICLIMEHILQVKLYNIFTFVLSVRFLDFLKRQRDNNATISNAKWLYK